MKTTVCFSPHNRWSEWVFVVAYTTTTSAIPDVHYYSSLSELPAHLKDAGQKAVLQPFIPVHVQEEN